MRVGTGPGCGEEGRGRRGKEFGSRLKLVSLLAPEDVLRRDIEEHFVDLVTPELLNKWLDDPTAAPGRLTSSPWPECIAVDEVKLDGTTRGGSVGTSFG